MAVTFSGKVSGQVYQGGVKADPSLKSGQFNGLRMKFAGGNPSSRYVVVDGGDLGAGEKDLHLTLERGASANIQSKSGYDIAVDGQSLRVNGQTVDFGALERTGSAASPDASPAKSLADLQQRFPGVKFDGDMNMAHRVKIGPDVRIKPGATIELGEAIEISGKASIGPNARISGGTIADGSINGRVRGGELNNVTLGAGVISGGIVTDSRVGKGAIISGGEIEESTVEGKGTRIKGGEIEHSKILDGAKVDGGIVVDARLSQGAHVKGGVVEEFHLQAQTLSGGLHVGGLSPNWDEATKTCSRTDIHADQAHATAEAGGRTYNPGLYSMDYQSMMNTYDPNMLGYQNQTVQPYGGSFGMPQTMFGHPGLVAPNPYAGFGTGALLGMGGGALLGMGMGAFGMGMYGMGMGGLGMMGMMGMGMGGLGLGGFNWFCW